MKKIIAIMCLGLLASCASQADQQADLQRVRSELPDGCVVRYAGEVRIAGDSHPSRVFYTVCGSITTSTENHTVTAGKTSYNSSTVSVTPN